MAKRLISLAGKVIRRPVDELDADRYQYLSLEQAEPNPGNPDSDNSLFFSNADGTRGFTKKPILNGLLFEDGQLPEAEVNDDFALILKTNPFDPGDDSVGFRQLGDLAFSDFTDLNLQIVTQGGNTTDQGIVLQEIGSTGADVFPGTVYALRIEAENSMQVDGYSRFDNAVQFGAAGSVNLDGNTFGSGFTGLNSIRLVVLGDADSVGSRLFNFTNFTAPTLQQVVEQSIAAGDQGSSGRFGATTDKGIRATFLQFGQLPKDRGVSKTSYRKGLVIESIDDSIGYRDLRDLAIFDSTTDDIRVNKIDVVNPTTGNLPGSGTVPLVKWNSISKEYEVVNIEVTNLDDTFETLHSVSGRQEVGYDTGETGNRVIFSNTVKLRGTVNDQPLQTRNGTNTVLVAETFGIGDSAIVGVRLAEDIAFNSSLVTLDFVLGNDGTSNQEMELTGNFILGNRGDLGAVNEPRVLAIGGGDSVGFVNLNTIAFTGTELDTLQSVTDQADPSSSSGFGDSTDHSITVGGLVINNAAGIGFLIDSAVIETGTNTFNRFLVYDDTLGKVILRELNNNLLDGEDDTLQSVTERGNETDRRMIANGILVESATSTVLRVTDSATIQGPLSVTNLNTNDAIVFTGPGGELEVDANLTFDGTTLQTLVNFDVGGTTTLDSTTIDGDLTVTDILEAGETTVAGITVSDITAGRIPYATTGGKLTFNDNLQWDNGNTKLLVQNVQVNQGLDVLGNFDVDGTTTLDSTNIDGGLNLTNLQGDPTALDVLIIDAENEVQRRSIESTAFTGETLETVTDPTRPAGFNTTTTPLYLNGGISTIADPVTTAATYNLLVLQTPAGDSVEYLTVNANILDGTALGLDDVLANNNQSGRDIILTGTGGLNIAGASTLDSVTVNELVVLGDMRVEGTQTIINSTVLSVNDVNITLADSALVKSDADGGGITVNLGADGSATLLYGSVNDDFTFNKDLVVPSLQVGGDLNVDGVTTLDSTAIVGGLNLSSLVGVEDDTVLTIDPSGEVQARDVPAYIFTGPTLQDVTENGRTTTIPVYFNGGASFNISRNLSGSNDNIEIMSLTANDSAQYYTLGDLLDIVNLQYVTDHNATTSRKVTIQGGLVLENLTNRNNNLTVAGLEDDSVVSTVLETTAFEPLANFTIDAAVVRGSNAMAQRLSASSSIDLDGGFTAALTNPGTPTGQFDVIRLADAGGTDSAFRVTLNSGATQPLEEFTWAFTLEQGDSSGGYEVHVNDGLWIDRTQITNQSPWSTSLQVPVFHPDPSTAAVGDSDRIGRRTLGTVANRDDNEITLSYVTSHGQTALSNGTENWSQTTDNVIIGKLKMQADNWTGVSKYTGTQNALFYNVAHDSVGYRALGDLAFENGQTLYQVTNFPDGATFSGVGDSTDQWLKMKGITITNANQIYIKRGNFPLLSTDAALMWDSDTDQVGYRKLSDAAFLDPTLQAVTEAGDSTDILSTFGGGLELPPGGTTLLDGAAINTTDPQAANFWQMLVINTDTNRVARGQIGVINQNTPTETLKTVTNYGASLTTSGIDSTNENVAFTGDFYLTNLANDATKTQVIVQDEATGKLFYAGVDEFLQQSTLDTVAAAGNKTQHPIAASDVYLRYNPGGVFADTPVGTAFSGEYKAALLGRQGGTRLQVDSAEVSGNIVALNKLSVGSTINAQNGTITAEGEIMSRGSTPRLSLRYDSGGADEIEYRLDGGQSVVQMNIGGTTTFPWFFKPVSKEFGIYASNFFPSYNPMMSFKRDELSGAPSITANERLIVEDSATFNFLTTHNDRVNLRDAFFDIDNLGVTRYRFSAGANFVENVAVTTAASLAGFTEISGNGANESIVSLTRHSNNEFGSYLVLAKNRGDSAFDLSPIQNGDQLGSIIWNGVDNTSQSIGASLRVVANDTVSSGNLPTKFQFSTYPSNTESIDLEIDDNYVTTPHSINMGNFLTINNEANGTSSGINVKTDVSNTISHFIAFDSADNGSGDSFTKMRFGVKSIADGFVTNQLILDGQNGASITTDYSSTDFKLDNRTNGAATASKLLFTSGNSTSATQEYEYAEIRTVFTERTAGSETARMELRVAGNDFGAAGTRVKIDSAGEVLVTDTEKLKLDTGVKLQDANDRTLVIYDSAGAVLWGNV